jgi:DnaJ-class molecular chaperone
MKKDFYETLGVNKSATQADIKSAYRKMALQYHPDKNKATDAEEKFKEINEAYEVLSNAEKRSAYDQFGHAAFDPSRGPSGHTHSQQQGPFNYTWSSSGGQNPFGNTDFDFGGFSNPFDIFEQFFGNAGFSGSSRGRSHRLETYKIQVSFMDAVKGCDKEVSIDGKRKKIKIPAGVNDGQRIQFSDFILYIDVLPDNYFKREDNDIYVIQNITIKQAILGDVVTVPTLNEPLKVRVQPGTQANTLIRLRGKGIPDVNGYGIGDFYIRLNIVIPNSITRKDRQLIEQLDI